PAARTSGVPATGRRRAGRSGTGRPSGRGTSRPWPRARAGRGRRASGWATTTAPRRGSSVSGRRRVRRDSCARTIFAGCGRGVAPALRSMWTAAAQPRDGQGREAPGPAGAAGSGVLGERAPHLLQGLALDLADALGGHAELVGQLVQRHGAALV